MKVYIFFVMALFAQPLFAASYQVKADFGGGYQSPRSFGLWLPEMATMGNARLGISLGEQNYHSGVAGKSDRVRSHEVELGLNKSSEIYEGLAVSQTLSLGYSQTDEVSGISNKLQYTFLDYNVGFIVPASEKGQPLSSLSIEPGVGTRVNLFDPRKDHSVGREVVESQSVYPYLRLTLSL